MRGGSVEILLVEADEVEAEAVIRAFRGNHIGNQMLWLRDGKEALEYLHDREEIMLPKLILWGLDKARIDDIENLRQIRAKRAYIIALVSQEDSEWFDGLGLAVNQSVTRPIDLGKILSVIGSHGKLVFVLDRDEYHE